MEDNNDKKLKFILAMTKHGLRGFDAGGALSGAAIGAEAGSAVPGLGTLAGAGIGALAGMGFAGGPYQGTPGMQNPYVQSNATNPNTGISGTIGGLLGTNNNFQASSANVTPGTNTGQLTTAYQGAQNALSGFSPVSQYYNQLASGTGPNPAQTQLAQATGANVANQAALMAGQRGSGSNIGLLARQQAQQGNAIQQQAAGQAATLGAQQQVAGIQGLAGNVQAENAAQQGEQGILQGANSNFNNTITSMQSNINNVNSQTAASNAKGAGGLLGSVGSALSSLFAEGGKVKKMATGGTFQEPVQAISANPLLGNQENGLQSHVGQSIAGSSNVAGADVGSTASGDTSSDSGKSGLSDFLSALQVGNNNPMAGATSMQGQDSSEFGGSSIGDSGVSGLSGAAESSGGGGDYTMLAASGGQIRDMANKGSVVKAKAKSEKAVKPGNDYKNDKIPAMLSEGEVVLDRDTMNDPGQIGQMARALKSHIERRNKK